MQKILSLLVSLSWMISSPAIAEKLSDGTYDAEVTTKSGTYTVPVEVEDGEVTTVNWPNGGNMSVHNADIDSTGTASGSNSRGDSIEIEIDN